MFSNFLEQSKFFNVIRVSMLMVVGVGLSGCGFFGTDDSNDSITNELPKELRRENVQRAKTLDNYQSLVGDHRAKIIGDSVTVLIYEEASSTTSAETRTDKSLDVSGGFEKTNRLDFGSLEVESGGGGQGSISRQGRLRASVSASVVDVRPTGELVIYGEQVIQFNDEAQHIRVSGVIRPSDISANNTVLSSRMTLADITYVGDGLLGSRQRPGVVTRLFNWLF